MSFSFETPEQPPVSRRNHLRLMALVYTFFTLVCGFFVVTAIVNISAGNSGYFVMLSVFGLVGLMTGYWMFQYARDLGATPMEYEGEVQRKWHKSNLLFFFMQSYYVRVDRKIFTIPRNDYASLLETDLVRIRAFPHSLMVEQVDRYDEVGKKFVPADVGEFG